MHTLSTASTLDERRLLGALSVLLLRAEHGEEQVEAEHNLHARSRDTCESTLALELKQSNVHVHVCVCVCVCVCAATSTRALLGFRV